MVGNMPRPKIRGCDDSIGLFIGETERGKIRRKDMSPMGDKVNHQSIVVLLAHILLIVIQISDRKFLHGFRRSAGETL